MGRSSKFRGSRLRASTKRLSIVLGATGVALLVVSGMVPAASHVPPGGASHSAFHFWAAPALVVPTPTTNTSTLDLGMSLNASVNISQITGGSGNASNWSFSWLGLPGGCASANEANYTCVPNAAGTFSVQVKVTDSSTGQSNTSASVDIQVNTDPVVDSFTVTSTNISLGTELTLTTAASGGTAPLVYVYGGLPAGCSGNTSTIVCTPKIAQTYNPTVYVTDAIGFASNTKALNITVTAAGSGSSEARPTPVQWGEIAAILIVGLLVAVLLFRRARTEEQRSYAATPKAGSSTGSSGPPGGSPGDGKPPTR